MRQNLSDEQVYMNTRIRIQVISESGTIYTREKISEAFAQFDYVVKKYTRFNDTSELAKLNSHSGKPWKVDKEMFTLIEFALEVARISEGAFDPTIIDLLEAYGYDKNYDFEKLKKPELIKEISELVTNRPSYKDIQLDKSNLTVELAPKQRLDMGSIGKGYAIDLAYEVLNEFPGFIINAGGDIRSKGENLEGKPWSIALYKAQLPNGAINNDNILGKVNLVNQSIAGSGGWARRVGFFHHLINPRSGLPENNSSQTYVIADQAINADAWATTVFILGQPGLKLAERLGLEALLIDSAGNIYQTPGFKYS